MILDETLRQKLSEGSPGSGRREVLATHADSGWTVRLTVDKQDAMSCLLWEARVQTDKPGSIEMRTWAERIAERMQGLMERLKVLEIDTTRNQALLRSDSPTQRKDVQAYFEILLEGTTAATLRRYQVPVEGHHKREQVAFPLTHEAIFKLVEDLTSR